VTVKIDQPSEVGEYDTGMQVLLQLIWGDGFLSPGGPEEIERLLEGEDLRQSEVLDIGCGLGAVDELLVTRHGARSVVGIDVDPGLLNQMELRIERAGLAGRVQARVVSPGPLPFPDASFDIVFSKDALVQIPGKAEVFREAWRVLRPGGRFIASDWLRGGEGAYSPEMLEFFRLEGIAYNMASIEQSRAALTGVGFVSVEVLDRNDWYRDLARRELAAMEGRLAPVITERIGRDRARHFVDNWRQLVIVLERGELRPAHLKGTRPAAGR